MVATPKIRCIGATGRTVQSIIARNLRHVAGQRQIWFDAGKTAGEWQRWADKRMSDLFTTLSGHSMVEMED